MWSVDVNTVQAHVRYAFNDKISKCKLRGGDDSSVRRIPYHTIPHHTIPYHTIQQSSGQSAESAKTHHGDLLQKYNFMKYSLDQKKARLVWYCIVFAFIVAFPLTITS